MGGAVFLPAIYLGPDYGGGNEDNGDLLLKIPGMYWTLSAPNPAAGHRRPTPLLETPGHSQASLGQSSMGSLLPSSGSWCTRFCLCRPRSFSQSCVSSGSSMVGLMATSSKRASAIPKSAAPRAPVPVAVHCWPVPPQEMLRHSSLSVSVGSLGPGAHKICLSPLSVSGRNGVWF